MQGKYGMLNTKQFNLSMRDIVTEGRGAGEKYWRRENQSRTAKGQKPVKGYLGKATMKANGEKLNRDWGYLN